MPSVSKAQHRFMLAELSRRRKGKPARTGLTLAQLREFVTTPEENLPERKPSLRVLRVRMRRKRR